MNMGICEACTDTIPNCARCANSTWCNECIKNYGLNNSYHELVANVTTYYRNCRLCS